MKTKLRASKISIESPREDSEVWVHVTVQQMIYDDESKISNIIPNYDYISKPLSKFMPDNYTYIDPLDGSINNIYGSQVMYIITAVILEWMTNKYGGTLDEGGNLWL